MLRKVPETAWLMLNLFWKWSHSSMIFSLRNSFTFFFFLWAWVLLLDHCNSFMMPLEHTGNCIEKRVLWDTNSLGFQLVLFWEVFLFPKSRSRGAGRAELPVRRCSPAAAASRGTLQFFAEQSCLPLPFGDSVPCQQDRRREHSTEG